MSTSFVPCALVVVLLVALPAGAAEPPVSTGTISSIALEAAAEPADPGTRSIAGSTITALRFGCYIPGATRALCFSVHNASPDAEWIDRVRLTFPTMLGAWTVGCSSQDPNDSSGNPVGLVCGNTAPNEIVYQDPNGFPGEIASGASWTICVDATVPAAYNGPRIVNWGLSGDEEPLSVPPHDITGSLELAECPPLALSPPSVSRAGCSATPQPAEFLLWNNTGSDGTFALGYNVLTGNAEAYGPDAVELPADGIRSVSLEVLPQLCLPTDDYIAVVVGASGNSASAEALFEMTVANLAGFAERTPAPLSTMDNVVAWAVGDGGLWSIGGYHGDGTPSVAQRYDPATDSWALHATAPEPHIEYPGDGCYGLNADGDEVVVLFPDTQGEFRTRCDDPTDPVCVLQRYNVKLDAWDEPPVPVGYPVIGRWAHDVVSMYAVTGQNVCYLSGGATTPGSGEVRDLWEYHPDTNITIYLGHFTHIPIGFNFHASWYVPWVGPAGSICVGGGAIKSSGATADTQCYDLATSTFRTPNADLGPLPEPWWGMADGWNIVEGQYRIWIANGVGQDGALIGATAWADAGSGGFVYGPPPPVKIYRGEGDGLDGSLFLEQGAAAGGFQHTPHNFELANCPARHADNELCPAASEVWIGTHAGRFLCAEADGSASCSLGLDKDVWFRVVAPIDGFLRASTCGSHDLPGTDLGPDTILSAHFDCAGNEVPGMCNDDWFTTPDPRQCDGLDTGLQYDAVIEWPVLSGQPYLLRLATYTGMLGDEYRLNLEFNAPAGRVPDGTTPPAAPLRLARVGGQVELTWDPSCLGDPDYTVYGGIIGNWVVQQPVTCSTGGARTWLVPAVGPDEYYLVVPNNGFDEGSYGFGGTPSAPWQRPTSPFACMPQAIGECP